MKLDYQKLLLKFFTKEIKDSEIEQLKSWIEAEPENRKLFDADNELWQEINIESKLEQFKMEKRWKNLSTRLQLNQNNNKKVILVRRTNYWSLVAAAVIAFIIILGGLNLYRIQQKDFQQKFAASTIISTREGERSHVFLPDSTEIILNAESRLEYNAQFNLKDRHVKFTGEGFFNIHSNADKPFIVLLDEMNITVTGTRFNVLSYENEERVETTLEEGEIQVTFNKDKPIQIKPGQQVVYFKNTKEMMIREVDLEAYFGWKENKIRFVDTPFDEVLLRLGRVYNVDFEIKHKKLLDFNYTGTFIDESIEEIMRMLSIVSPINYEIHYRTAVTDTRYIKPMISVHLNHE